MEISQIKVFIKSGEDIVISIFLSFGMELPYRDENKKIIKFIQ